MGGAVVYRFGPFKLDAVSGQLFRRQSRIYLADSHAAVLIHLVSRAGLVVSKEALIEAGWGGVAVAPNSVDQAISRLRRVLGDERKPAAYVETLPSRGYRFTASVERGERDAPAAALAAELAPFMAFVQGETDLYSLDRHAIQRVRCGLEDAVRRAPDYAEAHVGLAMACGLLFEASRVDPHPDTVTLDAGIQHAQRGRTLDPASANAWSTLSFLLYLSGDSTQAAAAALKATTIDPEDWRHLLRMAYATWGGHRLRAARRLLALYPGLALAYWLRATVFIARGLLDAALQELRLGCAAQDAQVPGDGLPAVGLHLLHGLVLAARNQLPEAEAALVRELSFADSTQVYARECAANTWYALGAVALRLNKDAEAETAFARALAVAPCHVSAAAALRREVPTSAAPLDTALAQAIVLSGAGRRAEAACVYREAIAQAPPGSAGWSLAVEPLLSPLRDGDLWSGALALIRTRSI